MKMPFGPQWLQDINWKIPNVVMAGVPGFEKMATGLMQQTVKNNGVASIQELRELCIKADVKLVAWPVTCKDLRWKPGYCCRLERGHISLLLIDVEVDRTGVSIQFF